jgi:glucoamylase
MEFAKAVAQAGDAVLNRVYQHVKSDGGHIYEQISRSNGSQLSAKDLTWSFANILTALHYRNVHLSHLFKA